MKTSDKTQQNNSQETGQDKDTFFYFNLSDESHEKIVKKEEERLEENPLEPLSEEISEVEF